MPKNLELKAHIKSQKQVVDVLKTLGAQLKAIYYQRDIYYNVKKGRLKLRINNNKDGELIYYNRKDGKGNRYSDYLICDVKDFKKMDVLLRKAFSWLTIVEKKRQVFLYKNSRIHIDQVKQLGLFIEFEVQVRYGKVQAEKLMDFLMSKFGIIKKDLIACSYSDLIIGR